MQPTQHRLAPRLFPPWASAFNPAISEGRRRAAEATKLHERRGHYAGASVRGAATSSLRAPCWEEVQPGARPMCAALARVHI